VNELAERSFGRADTARNHPRSLHTANRMVIFRARTCKCHVFRSPISIRRSNGSSRAAYCYSAHVRLFFCLMLAQMHLCDVPFAGVMPRVDTPPLAYLLPRGKLRILSRRTERSRSRISIARKPRRDNCARASPALFKTRRDIAS